MTITEIKNHFASWANTFAVSTENEWHKAVTHFVSFIEGKQEEADAVSLLQSKGYTVTPPQQP